MGGMRWILMILGLLLLVIVLFNRPDVKVTTCIVSADKVVLNTYDEDKLISSIEVAPRKVREWRKGMGRKLHTIEGRFGLDYSPSFTSDDFEILKVYSSPHSFYREWQVEKGCYKSIREAWNG